MLFESENNIGSPYNIGLYINSAKTLIIKNYLYNRLILLLNDLGIAQDNFEELSFADIFTDKEFNNILPEENEESFINKHFYFKLYGDLKKKKVFDKFRNKEYWDLHFKHKYCFTIDSTLTPEISYSGVQYGTLNIGLSPILYYIFIDIQSIIEIIKET
jgi:hypothetical protein